MQVCGFGCRWLLLSAAGPSMASGSVSASLPAPVGVDAGPSAAGGSFCSRPRGRPSPGLAGASPGVHSPGICAKLGGFGLYPRCHESSCPAALPVSGAARTLSRRSPRARALRATPHCGIYARTSTSFQRPTTGPYNSTYPSSQFSCQPYSAIVYRPHSTIPPPV